MNRRDHHCSPIAPRLLTALIPPSTRIGLAGGQSSQEPLNPLMLFPSLASGAPLGTAFPRRSFLAPQSRRYRAPLARSFAYRVRGEGEHGAQVGDGQLGEPALAGAHDAFGQGLLLLDHRVDPLLQRADADELADLDVA